MKPPTTQKSVLSEDSTNTLYKDGFDQYRNEPYNRKSNFVEMKLKGISIMIEEQKVK